MSNALDKLTGFFAPRWTLDRMAARASMTQMESFGGGSGEGYASAMINRLTKLFSRSSQNENALSGQSQALRAQSWQQYRNNPHARKIVRSLESKVIGRGHTPQSLATNADGTPNVEFRTRAQQLWQSAKCCLDDRGHPGYGGEEAPGLAKLALRSTILSGEILFQLRVLTRAEMKDRGAHVPVSVQLIDADRLDVGRVGPNIFRGVELDSEGRRLAYWILDHHPSDPRAAEGNESRPFPAEQIGHLYVADDIDQLRGTPWFAPILMQARDTADYQQNVLVTSSMAACFVAGVRRPPNGRLGLNAPVGEDSTDVDGNRITRLSPGMFLDLGAEGEFDTIAPAQPTTNAEGWIQHLIRSTATGMPGIKASTLTGDFRNASFSSERSADNDCWPEIEALQDWFSAAFYQPIFARVIEVAVFMGLFDDVVDTADFAARKLDFTGANWQGPVARSINPVDDAQAARERIKGGTSSPQIEAGMQGRNWREILADIAEFQEVAAAMGLPEAFISQAIGIEPVAVAAPAEDDGEDEQEEGADVPQNQAA